MAAWIVFCPLCRGVLETGWCHGCHDTGQVLDGHFACEVPWLFLRGVRDGRWGSSDYDASYMDMSDAKRYGDCRDHRRAFSGGVS